jgi:hypothetical protein
MGSVPTSEFQFNPKRAVIALDLPCRTCGYDLRGVRFDHECPECGEMVENTVRAAVDPLASGLPTLSRPRSVGAALIWLLLCAIVTSMAGLCVWTSGAAYHAFDARWSLGEAWGAWGEFVREWPCGWIAAASAAAGLVSPVIFARHLGPVPGANGGTAGGRRASWMIAGSLLVIAGVQGWLILAAEQASARSSVPFDAGVGRLMNAGLTVALSLAGVVGLIGLGRVLAIVGERSRVYREARGGRQGVRAMNAAVLAIALGAAVNLYGWLWRWEWIETIGRVMVISSAIMVFIGLLYLAVNAWWIMLALRRPPLRLRDVVKIEPDTTIARPGG